MNTVDENYILETCRRCGNKGLLKIVGSHGQSFIEYKGYQPIFREELNWTMLECPVCNSVSLHKSYTNDSMLNPIDDSIEYDGHIEYPEVKYSFPNVPKGIVKSYEAAVKTSKIDLKVSLIAIRAVLEKICVERGTKKKTLETMLRDMVSKNILPETLDKCGYLIRKLGNSGAHGDDSFDILQSDVDALIDFIETIMYYIYELPVKIRNLNDKYNLNKQNPENPGDDKVD